MAKIQRIGELSQDEYAVIDDFLEYYKDHDVVVADEYNRSYNALPIPHDVDIPKGYFRESGDYVDYARFHRFIPKESDNYHIDLTMVAKNNIWIGDKLSIRKNGEEYHEVGDGTFSPTGYYYNCSSSVVGELLGTFNSKKIMTAEQAYFDRIRDYHGLFNGSIEAHDWSSLYHEVEHNPSIGNLILFMSSGDVENGYFGAKYGTVLYQLLAYRNNHYKSLSKNDLEQLDYLIMSVRDGEILGLNLNVDDNYCGVATNLHDALKPWDSYSVSIKSQQLTPQNGGAIKEQDTLQKLLRIHR